MQPPLKINGGIRNCHDHSGTTLLFTAENLLRPTKVSLFKIEHFSLEDSKGATSDQKWLLVLPAVTLRQMPGAITIEPPARGPVER